MFSTKKAVLLLIVTLISVSFGNNLTPTDDRGLIAVYITGEGIPDNILLALNTQVLSHLTTGRGFRGAERADLFLDAIGQEFDYQQSGMVSDDEIRRIGQHHGLTYICVGNITRVFSDFLISTRIINIETSEVIALGVVQSNLGSLRALDIAAKDAVDAMLEGRVRRRSRVATFAQNTFESNTTSIVDRSGPPQVEDTLLEQEIYRIRGIVSSTKGRVRANTCQRWWCAISTPYTHGDTITVFMGNVEKFYGYYGGALRPGWALLRRRDAAYFPMKNLVIIEQSPYRPNAD